MKLRIAVCSLIGAAVVVAAVMTSGGPSVLSEESQWHDVTDDAVQSFYQDYAPPHTDRAGRVLHSYAPESSVFPIGIYYPWPCTTSHTLDWSAYAPEPGPEWGWDGETYRLWVRFPGDWDLGKGADLHSAVVTGTSATVDILPANVDLWYMVYIRENDDMVWLHAENFTIGCPERDPDDPNAIETLAQAGFNVAIAGSGPGHPYVLLELKERAANAEDFTFVPGVGTGSCYDPPCNADTCTEPHFNQAMFDRYNHADWEDDIFGFYIDDEPLLRALKLYGQCEAGDDQYQREWHFQNILDSVIAKYEPYKELTDHAIFLTEGASYSHDWWDDFISVGDAASHDHYPYPAYGSLDTLQGIAESVSSQTVIASEEQKPSWLTVEAFDWYHLHFPTPEEMRATVYTAIVHGATGVWHFVWDSYAMRPGYLVGIRPEIPGQYPEGGRSTISTTSQKGEELWESLAGGEGEMGLNAELATLASVILSRTSEEEYHVYIDQEPGPGGRSPVRTMLKLKDDAYYLIAVNMDDAPVDARFEFTGHGIASPQVMFEPEEVANAEGNILSDHFEPFAAHVYRFYLDTDLDGVGDVEEVLQGTDPAIPDTDGDGFKDKPATSSINPNTNPGEDNCPLVNNPDQTNTPLGPIDNGPDVPGDHTANPYEDMVGDACDDDADNDGLPDEQEYDDVCPYRSTRDSDGDWLPDGIEVLLDSDPCDADDRPPAHPGVDKDRDGLPDWLDAALCPLDVDWDGLIGDEDLDCDGDGLNDGTEVRGWGTDPFSRDSDGDGCDDDKEVADVDGTKQANILDALWVARAAFGTIACHGTLDLDGTGNCDIYDAMVAAKNSTLLEPHQPCP